MSATIPPREEIERYIALREACKGISHATVDMLPREAMLETGRALGIVKRDTLVLDAEDEASVLMDCCIYDWIRDGRNMVQRYAAHGNTAGDGTPQNDRPDVEIHRPGDRHTPRSASVRPGDGPMLPGRRGGRTRRVCGPWGAASPQTGAARSRGGTHSCAGAARPQRPLPLRQRPEVQALLRPKKVKVSA